MQNIPINQLSPELIQMLLTQGMFQPIEQANPYVNMIDPNIVPMDQLAYNSKDYAKSYDLKMPYYQHKPAAQRGTLNVQFNNPNLINNGMNLNEANNLRPEDSRIDNTIGARTKLQRGAYEAMQKGLL